MSSTTTTHHHRHSPPPNANDTPLLVLFGTELSSHDLTGALLALLIAALLYHLLKIRQRFATAHPKALDPDHFQAFPLLKKEILSHDTRRFTFKLQSDQHYLGLPVGQHVTLKYTDSKSNKSIQRSYTPVSRNDEFGIVTFVIKVYKAGVHPKFPEGGKMSQHLDSLDIGDTIDMKGPKGHVHYLGKGELTVKLVKQPLQTRHAQYLNMMAGGTGITPMLQILHAIFLDPADKTQVKMIYANQTEDDILVREELETLRDVFPKRFQLHYTVDRPPASGWKYSTGFITKDMIAKHLYPPDKKQHRTQVYMCGPPPMIRFACIPALKELGFTEDDWVVS